MTRLLRSAACAWLLAPAGAALAQVPFDMTPEHYLVEPPAPVPETPQEAPPVVDAFTTRHLFPRASVVLSGEIDREAFDFYLTEEQASAAARLHLSVLNSVVVSPEDSRAAITINGTRLANAPIAFSSAPAPLSVDIAEGVLVPGRNRIDIEVSQRHRTDCSVDSTYALWSQFDGAQSYLRLEGPGLGRVRDLTALPAIGSRADGTTGLDIHLPQWQDPAATEAALALVQELALALRAPALEVTLIEDFEGAAETGVLTVILATADALPDAVGNLRAQAQDGPMAGFAPHADLPNALVISGPDWAGIGTAIQSVQLRRATHPADDFGMLVVDLPDSVPLITGRTEIALHQLGVETVEFNGRRYHTALRFALPADFYAEMYGEAELVLDAAYSAAVLPGSQLDIHVNGQIAAGIPVLRTEGGTFRDSRVRIPMTNFRPGINEMEIDAALLTREDEVCPPGFAGNAPARFLFSADSRLAIPDFGRIAQYPDLSALAGTGAPYAGSDPVQIALGEDRASIAAALALGARLALAAGEAMPLVPVPVAALDAARDALVVAPMTALPPALLARGGIVGLDATGRVPSAGSGSDALERWRESAGAPSSNFIERIQGWAADRLGLMPENFWLIRRADGAFVPQSSDAAILAQARQDEGGVWTYLTIPDPDAFAPAARGLTRPDIWRQVSGRVSAAGASEDAVLVLAPHNTTLVASQPPSFANLRQVTANRLSTNVMGYAVILAALALLLTITTSILLSAKGRRAK